MSYTSDWGGPEPLEDEDAVLHRVVLDQTAAQLAIPVLLLTDDVLVADPAGAGAVDPGAADVGEGADLAEVTRLASDLGLDLDELALFSADAYQLQCALGQAALARTPEQR